MKLGTKVEHLINLRRGRGLLNFSVKERSGENSALTWNFKWRREGVAQISVNIATLLNILAKVT